MNGSATIATLPNGGCGAASAPTDAAGWDCSMRFLIDGYNVTMRDPATRDLGAGEQRAALARRLGARGRELLGAGAVTIVWDGRSDGYGATAGPVAERYSGDVSADDVIVALAEPGDTVVTSDRQVAQGASANGAQVRTADAVFEEASGHRPKRRRRAADAGLPRGADDITRELKDLWLKDEE